MRILVRSQIGNGGGYARDGEGLIKALVRREHEVDIIPTNVLPPLSKEVAELLTYPVTAGYDLEIHHVPPMNAECGGYNHQRSRRTVLWTMWEWDNFIKDEVEQFAGLQQVGNYSQVVGYTQQSLDALNSIGVIKEGQDTFVSQGGFDPAPWGRVEDAIPELQEKFPYRKYEKGTYRFGVVGHLSGRKNPYKIIQAFTELKEEHDLDAELILKTSMPLLPEGAEPPGVKIIQEIGWSDAQMKYFYWTLDSLLNFSLGEGKDLPALEATACGTPVVINDTPGHRGWMHPGIQNLVPTSPRKYFSGHVGRDTSLVDMKEAMLYAYNHKYKTFDVAKQLAEYVTSSVSWDKRVERFGKTIGVDL